MGAIMRRFLAILLLVLMPAAVWAQTAAELSAEVSDDRGFITRLLERNLSDSGRQVLIEGFQGALSSRATFTRLTIADEDGVWITLNNGAIQWNRSALLRGRIEIAELSAAEILLPRLPGGGQDSGPTPEVREFALPDLPVSVNIARIAADRVELGEPVIGLPAVVSIDGSMNLEGGEGVAKLTIDRKDGPRGKFVLDAGYSNASKVLKLDLKLDEGRDGLFVNLVDLYDKPAVTAEISGEGPLSDFMADIRLATDGQPRVTGRASATERAGADGTPGLAFRLELGGDVASLLSPDNRTFFGPQTQLLAEGWRGEDGRIEVPVLMIDTNALNLSGSLTTNAAGAPQQAVLMMTLGADAGATQLPVTLPFTGTQVNDGRLSLQYDASQGAGWSLEGRIGQVTQPGLTIGALTLNGAGTVAVDGEDLDEILGKITFGAKGLAFDDPALAQAVGEAIIGETGFSYAPDNAAEFSGLTITGSDYGLSGDVLVAGLSGGITVSGSVDARYENLTRLSDLAGRPLTGRADARIEGLYQVLTRAFDVDAEITGTDITVDQDQLDRLLVGQSRIGLMARRDETGIEISELAVNAQRLTATAQGRIDSASSDLTAKISMPSLTDADAQLGGSLEAEAFLNGPTGQRRLTISGQAQDLRVGIPEVDGLMRGATALTVIAGEKDGGYLVEQFRFANPQVTAEGTGNFTPGELAADVALDLPDLEALGRGWAGSLTAKATAREENGVRFVDLTGQGQNLRLGQANVDGMLAGPTDLTLQAEERDGVVTLRRFDVKNAQLTATGAGVYGPGVTDLSADVNIASLAALGQGWRGALTAQARVQDEADGARRLTLDGTGRDLALGQQNVDGVLSGPTRITANVVQRGDGFTIEEARILNDQARIEARGTYAPGATDLTADIDLPRLAALGLGWRGSVQANASFREAGDGLRRLAVDGTANDLSLGQAQVDAALAGPTRLSVRGTEQNGVLTIEEARVDNARLQATATGRVGAGATDVQGRVNARDLRFLGNGIAGALNAEGRFVDEGGARRITATGTGTGLRLGQPRLDPLLAGATRFDLAARQQGEALSVERLDLRNPQVTLTASGSLEGGITLDARLADLALIEPRFPGPATAQGTVRQQGSDLVVNLGLTAPGNTNARVAGRVAQDGSNADLRISGTSNAAAANPFLRTRSVEGPIDFDLRLNGASSLAALSGQVRLRDGRLAEPKLGLRIEGLQVTADIAGERVTVSGSGNVSDGGRITLSGPIDLARGVVDVTAGLDGVVLRDPNLYQATLNGNLRVLSDGGAQGPLVSGTIAIAEAEIRIPSTGLGGAKAIPDIRHVGSQRPPVKATRAKAGLVPFPSAEATAAGMRGPAATPPLIPPRLDLTIDAPNRVFVRGRGVDAELGGRMRIQGTTRNVMPIGTLELIRGRVDLLGKRFQLTEGLIELQGSLLPVIRLVAETVQSEITTRIVIDGDARDPDIRFESSPQLPEEEVLSQLLFGRGLDNISALQAAQLANAVAVLAGRGGEGIVSRLRSSVGLDDLDLSTDDQGNVQVRAGKYLAENVYTDLSVSDDGKSKVNLNLDISESLRARGSVGSDGQGSIGLFYERDY